MEVVQSSPAKTSHSLTLNFDRPTYERIISAYQYDIEHISKQPIDFNQWLINCLLDWAEAVELEASHDK